MKHRKWLLRAVVAVAGCVASCAVAFKVSRSSADSQAGPCSLAPDLTLGAPGPPPIRTFVIYIDDKAGTVLEAQGF